MMIGVVPHHLDHYIDHTTKHMTTKHLGGCEDPRVVEDEEGTYWLMYTAFDGVLARLSVGCHFLFWHLSVDSDTRAHKHTYHHHICAHVTSLVSR